MVNIRTIGVLVFTTFAVGLLSCSNGPTPDDEPSYSVCEMRDGKLVKPDNPTGDNPFLKPGDVDTSAFDSGYSFRVFARPHMESMSGEQSWLYEGEPFVIDLAHMFYGAGDADLTMMVLLNFEPVPFKISRVTSADGYPSIEELGLEQEGSLVRQMPVTLEDGVPINYTLGVPASSFSQGRGTYDMRVVFVPDVAPSETPGLEQLEFSVDGFAFQVHYGSCDTITEPEIRLEDGDVITWTENLKQHLALAGGMFLAPPEDAYPWQDIENANESQMRQRFTMQPEGQQLTLYSLLTDRHKSPGLDTSEMVYVVFEGDEIIDAFRMNPPFKGDIGRDFYTSKDQWPVAKIRVPAAAEDTAQYTVMGFTNPRQPPLMYGGSEQVIASNTLFFRFEDEQ